jgi:cold shock CspA family protein
LTGLVEDQLVNYELVEGRDGRQMADEISTA